MDFSGVHKISLGGGFGEGALLLDIESGSLHRIDPLAELFWDHAVSARSFDDAVHALLPLYPREELTDLKDGFESLIKQGLLLSPPLPVPKALPKTSLKSLCLNISHDCNLRCRYCFAKEGSFGLERRHMPFDVARAALDYLFLESAPGRFCEVDFFGGEPLLNLGVMRRAVEYGKSAAVDTGKSVRFTLTTNAMALSDEVIDWVVAEDIAVVLSHDGRAMVHDGMRMLPNGLGSHDRVTERISRFLDKRRDNYYIRGTYTAYNTDFTEDVLHWLSLGYRELSMEPAVAESSFDWAITERHIPELVKEYHRLALLYRERILAGDPFGFFHFNLDLSRGPCLPKRLWGCGAGYEYLAVTPAGELYPCHQFVGREEYLLGDVWNGVINRETPERFKNAHLEAKPSCRKCWAKYLCSGGCHANAVSATGDLLKPYELGCSLQKIRLEAALKLAAWRLSGFDAV